MKLFADIPQLTDSGSYAVNHPWDYLEDTLEHYRTEYGFDMGENDFQRAHVWDETKQRNYVEYVLRGGHFALDIWTNYQHWGSFTHIATDTMMLVDGKQRLHAVLKFLDDRLWIFDHNYYEDFEDQMGMCRFSFLWHVNNLKTRKQILQWYIDLNAGGVAHTEAEIEHVRKLLLEEHR